MTAIHTKTAERIIITGGAGYIGATISYLLAQVGYEVVILDSLRYQQPTQHLAWATVRIGDCGDAALLDTLLSEKPVYAVVHCAALIEVGESVRDPAAFYANNVTKTQTLLDALRRHGVRNVIFSSSCAVYGVPATVPMTEMLPFAPISPYGSTKMMVEYMLQEYAAAYGITYVSLRYFNAAGALPEVGLGEYHHPEHHLIPLVLRALYRDEPFTVFGNDYDTPDGTAVRDYIHVHDIAQAHVLALNHLQKEGVSEVFNIGSGRGYSVREVITAAEQAGERKLRVIMGDRRPGDPAVLVADAHKARGMLGWQPQYSSLACIMHTALRWELQHQFFATDAQAQHLVRR